MASVIKLKRSSTPGSTPGSLEAGELAINLVDKKLFSSNGTSVFSIAGDLYNLESSSVDSGAAVTLTVDNNSLSNDSIQLLGGSGVTVTRNANSSVTFATVPVNDSITLGTHTTGAYVATVTGTANEIEVTGSGSETAAVTIGLPNNVTISDNLLVSENLTVSGNTVLNGNLEVNGTLTYIDSTTVTIGDNMLKLANTNTGDTIDTGYYVVYNDGVEKYAGIVRDATDGVFYLFDSLTTEPNQTINFGSTSTATLNAVIDGGTY